MRKISVFNQISLDGFFADESDGVGWAHHDDDEWTTFAADNASGGGALLFGRVTFQMMESYWPTAAARRDNAVVAAQMTALPKIVFSKTLQKTAWKNTEFVSRDLVAYVTQLKKSPGPDVAIMGSGSVVGQLTDARLIDTYQIVVNPVVLGQGRTIFGGVTQQLDLKLDKTRAFGNGNVVLWYTPRR